MILELALRMDDYDCKVGLAAALGRSSRDTDPSRSSRPPVPWLVPSAPLTRS